jgi:phosphopantothenoylcysteine decarboxylase/phosphopantothenate--cysteine ligase
MNKMMALKGKKILLAISGGIAAYKMNYLVRDFIKNGADVKVILTPSAENFVSKVTLSTLSKNPVFSDFYDENGTGIHVELDFGQMF